MQAVQLDSATISSGGLQGDREFAVVVLDTGGSGKFRAVTRRDKPELVKLSVEFPAKGILKLSHPKAGEYSLDISTNRAEEIIVNHYQHNSLAEDLGSDISVWLNALLGSHKDQELKFARFKKHMGAEKPDEYSGEHAPQGFLDRHPITIGNVSTLAMLNKKLAEKEFPIAKMEQFAPSITVFGLAPFEENSIKALEGDAFRLRFDVPVKRCAYINVDSDSGINLGAKGPLGILKEVNPLEQIVFGECCSVFTDKGPVTIKKGQKLRIVA